MTIKMSHFHFYRTFYVGWLVDHIDGAHKDGTKEAHKGSQKGNARGSRGDSQRGHMRGHIMSLRMAFEELGIKGANGKARL